MNVKTLILGVVMGGMIAAGTYFFVPTPSGAYANDCVTHVDLELAMWARHDQLKWAMIARDQALDQAVDKINAHTSNEVMTRAD